jgi:hypothetical protein
MDSTQDFVTLFVERDGAGSTLIGEFPSRRICLDSSLPGLAFGQVAGPRGPAPERVANPRK